MGNTSRYGVHGRDGVTAPLHISAHNHTIINPLLFTDFLAFSVLLRDSMWPSNRTASLLFGARCSTTLLVLGQEERKSTKIIFEVLEIIGSLHHTNTSCIRSSDRNNIFSPFPFPTWRKAESFKFHWHFSGCRWIESSTNSCLDEIGHFKVWRRDIMIIAIAFHTPSSKEKKYLHLKNQTLKSSSKLETHHHFISSLIKNNPRYRAPKRQSEVSLYLFSTIPFF